MLPSITELRARLADIIAAKHSQGYAAAGLQTELKRLPDSYDALDAFATKLAELPLKEDWPYVEPSDWEGIEAAAGIQRPLEPQPADPEEARARAETGFKASVIGCILGKALEIDPTLAEIREAAEATGEWPLLDYPSEALMRRMRAQHGDWLECVKERITHVALDDDLSYAVLGMLVLEEHGLDFSRSELAWHWGRNLPPYLTFGPERTFLARLTVESGLYEQGVEPQEDWALRWNPHDDLCGAAIRPDAYGYASPGNPAQASRLAWVDAGMTHCRTGIYASQYVAAAIALAFVEREPLAIFRKALQFVPQQSRFCEIVSDGLDLVEAADDWLSAYEQIHAKYHAFGHCRNYAECIYLANALHFSSNVRETCGKTVSQGADTDSFGHLAGAIAGVYFGPDGLEESMLEPFNDDFRVGLVRYHERSLEATAKRMGGLTELSLKRQPAGV